LFETIQNKKTWGSWGKMVKIPLVDFSLVGWVGDWLVGIAGPSILVAFWKGKWDPGYFRKI